ncbi:MAG: hypothetical protein DRQ56_10640 [Gammaproteobacteria bacterium]|nr:MAG: hypothetical protein DRQ56_10640 [Gammaproteobacteria bacterium]
MKKYFVLMFLVAGIGLFLVFIKDPCSKQVREDFSSNYPSYKILGVSASQGSPESVHCHISFQKPDSKQVFEYVWQYIHAEGGWEFSRAITTSETEPVH